MGPAEGRSEASEDLCLPRRQGLETTQKSARTPLGPKSNSRRLARRVSVAEDDAGEDLTMSDWVVIATTVVIGFLIRMFLF